MANADLLIHINEPLDPTEQASLSQSLRGIDGVIDPKFPEGTKHLLLVFYDPDETQSSQLLQQVKARGYTAQLIGL